MLARIFSLILSVPVCDQQHCQSVGKGGLGGGGGGSMVKMCGYLILPLRVIEEAKKTYM